MPVALPLPLVVEADIGEHLGSPDFGLPGDGVGGGAGSAAVGVDDGDATWVG